MANKRRAEVEVKFSDDAKPLILKFGMNELAELEDLSGVSINRLLFSGDIRTKTIRDALYVGLKKKWPTISPEIIGDKMDQHPERFTLYVKAVLECILLAQGAKPNVVAKLVKKIAEAEAEAEEAAEGDEDTPDPFETLSSTKNSDPFSAPTAETPAETPVTSIKALTGTGS